MATRGGGPCARGRGAAVGYSGCGRAAGGRAAAAAEREAWLSGMSRGGTPAPLSAGSGATPGGGAAGSEASETSERAGASGTRDERRRATTTTAAAGATRPAQGRPEGAARSICVLERKAEVGGLRGYNLHWAHAGLGPALPAMDYNLGKNDLDHCADVNGAPVTRTPPRRSWGRGAPPPGWRRIQARQSTCLLYRTASCAASTGRVPGIR